MGSALISHFMSAMSGAKSIQLWNVTFTKNAKRVELSPSITPDIGFITFQLKSEPYAVEMYPFAFGGVQSNFTMYIPTELDVIVFSNNSIRMDAEINSANGQPDWCNLIVIQY